MIQPVIPSSARDLLLIGEKQVPRAIKLCPRNDKGSVVIPSSARDKEGVIPSSARDLLL